MDEALNEARKGLTTAHPNPRVGCIFVKDGEIIARGFHAKTGQDHAEINAIKQASQSLVGSTCYVSLEPCAHHGRTPPCAHALIKQKIKRCVIACTDPFEQVSGQGIQILRNAGIEVTVGVCEAEAKVLNEGFFKRIVEHKPKVIAKVASSLDGKTAMLSGQSQWITGEAARLDAHALRAQVGAIITTYKTVNIDNAKLNVRHPLAEDPNFTQPLRVILDSDLKVNPKSSIFSQTGNTLIAVGEHVSKAKQQGLRHMVPPNVHIESFNTRLNRIDLQSVLHFLAKHQINEVLLECGPTLLGAFFNQNLIDEIIVYQAPKILGSHTKGMFDLKISQLNEHIGLDWVDVQTLGEDLKITARVRK